MSKGRGDVICGPDSLAATISKELEQWQMDCEVEMKRRLRKRARECKAKIQNDSPVRYGLYAKGWRSRVAYEGPRGLRIMIFNLTHPGLTHLLEYGHAIQNKPGKKAPTFGRTAGFPHIKPAEEEAKDGVIDDLIDVFGGA